MVGCLSIWNVWIGRCKFAFRQQKLSCNEVMLNIWFELVAWLRGRYDLIQGESEEAERARSKFLLKWSSSPMIVKSSSRPNWNYQAPRCLFPPMAPHIVYGL